MQKIKSLGVAVAVILTILAVIAGAYIIYMTAAALLLIGAGTLAYKFSIWKSSWK